MSRDENTVSNKRSTVHRVLLATLVMLLSPVASADDTDRMRADAERGNTRAQVMLGKAYFAGKDIKQSDADGAHWLRQAARAGDKVGQAWLGWAYEHGKGVRKDRQRAMTWYQRSARQGYDWAQQQIKRLNGYPATAEQTGERADSSAASAAEAGVGDRDAGPRQPSIQQTEAAPARAPVSAGRQDYAGAADESRHAPAALAQTAPPDLDAIEQLLRQWAITGRRLTLPPSLPLKQETELRLEIRPPPELGRWAAQGVGVRVMADLVVPGTELNALSKAAQALRTHHPAVWKWTVQPQGVEPVTVKLDLQARLLAPDREPVVVALGQVRRQLTIDSRFVDQVWPFVEENWVGISLTLVVPLFLWLGMSVAGRNRAGSGR